MDRNGIEKRRYIRIYFSTDQETEGIVSPAITNDNEFRVKILNLSEGGLFFILAQGGSKDLQVGNLLVLKRIIGPSSFHLDHKLDMEIKWINEDANLENIGYGCEFINPPGEHVEKFRNMIAFFPLSVMEL